MFGNGICHYDEDQMGDAVVSPFQSYEDILEDGAPEVVMPLGAPNMYEEKIRFLGAASDIMHNFEYGNDISGTVFLTPDDVELPEYAVDQMEALGVEFQEKDELYTTFDDWKSVEDITSQGDTVHGHTSDYHGLKTHMTGWSLMDFRDARDVETFGFETQPSAREAQWKHNEVVQTLDSTRQLLYVADERF